MFIKLSNTFNRLARGWAILICLSLFILFQIIPDLLFPEAAEAFGPMIHLDGLIYYTPETAFAAVESYGAAGRTLMVYLHILWDIPFPLIYTALLSLCISWLLQRGFPPGSWMLRLNLIPVLGGILDLLENTFIVILLLTYPSQPVLIARMSGFATLGKFISGIVIFALLMVGLTSAARNRFRLEA